MSENKNNDYLEHYENGIKIKKEIEIDYKGLSFSDSSSEYTSIDDQSSSKLNLSIEIDRKIDELIIKNIQKDLIALKINADLKINKYIIASSILLIVYSLLIFFDPLKSLNYNIYSIILIILPFFFLNSMLEYKNSYLKYSNALAKIIISVLSGYIFVCLISFIILINLLLIIPNYFMNINIMFFFLPIFAICSIITLFWGFLYIGYKNLEELGLYYYILFNIMIVNCFVLSIFMKLEFSLNYLKWINLLGLFCCVCTINFIVISQITFVKKEKNIYKNQDSIFVVIDILLKMCFLCFMLLLGLFLDNKIRGIKVVPIYIIVWFFNALMIIKMIIKNTTILNFFEWKKMVIC